MDSGARPELDALLEEQLRYYRRGSSEYHEANRTLLSANTADGQSRRRGFSDALAAIEAARGRNVLELAGGTGVYTERLARMATSLTVVDASPESLWISSELLDEACAPVEYVVSDIFSWQPLQCFDVVVFCFWLSHVPADRFEAFWGLVDRCLAEQGVVVVVDARAPKSLRDPVDYKAEPTFFSEQRIDHETSLRRLSDGSTFRIVRVMWDPVELRDRLHTLGWDARFDNESDWLVADVRRRS